MTTEYAEMVAQKEEIEEEITVAEKTGVRKSEVCFGVIMAIAALSGMWCAVSLMISYFIAS